MRKLFLALLPLAVALGCSRGERAVEPADGGCSAAVGAAIDGIVRLEGANDPSSLRTGCVVRVKGMSARAFRKTLEGFPGRDVHLWMPGERDWYLVGNLSTNRISLAAVLDAFANDTNCTMSVVDVFASYAGTREDILPAFASRLEGDVLPEWFVTKDIPKLNWLDVSGIDGDILRPMLAEIRSRQIVRREVLKGNMLAVKAKDKKGEEEAAAVWARAALRNPRDPLLLERIENLNRNARGFLEVGKVLQAMKCYETILLIRPDDATAIHNFGICLKRIGKLDMAEKVLERAKRLNAAARKE